MPWCCYFGPADPLGPVNSSCCCRWDTTLRLLYHVPPSRPSYSCIPSLDTARLSDIVPHLHRTPRQTSTSPSITRWRTGVPRSSPPTRRPLRDLHHRSRPYSLASPPPSQPETSGPPGISLSILLTPTSSSRASSLTAPTCRPSLS